MKTERYLHGQIYDVQLDSIIPKHNVGYYCPIEQEALTKSIDNYGVLQPLLVTQTIEGRLQIIDGDRRWHATQYTYLETIQIKYIDKDAEIISFSANMLRVDILPLEKAELMLALKKKFNYSHEDLAHLIGRSVPTISEVLSLNNLSINIKQICRNNRMFSHSALVKIAKIKNITEMENAFLRLQNKMKAVGGSEHTISICNSEKKAQKLINSISSIISEFDNLDENELSPFLRFNLNSAFRKLDNFFKKNSTRFI